MGHRITLLGSHSRELNKWLTGHPEGHERGAIVLFRRLARKVKRLSISERFLAVDIIKMTDDWVISTSTTHLTINLRKLPEIYLRCELENLELGFVHNHSDNFTDFSMADNINERNILHGLSGCNGPDAFLVAMILHKGRWLGRIRQGYHPNEILPVRHICILSERIELHGIPLPTESPELHKRQEAAFGKPFNSMLNSLRVAVVGLGGTGSPVATMLARAGVGEMILIDGDTLSESNMNRVHGYCIKDLDNKKAKSLSRYIKKIGLGTSILEIDCHLHEKGEALDALSSADVVLGCTDDFAGRDLMNQAVYYYGQILIDMGLTGKIDFDGEGNPYLRDHRGRVSCILPEFGACLHCQRVISEDWLKHEETIKNNPALKKLDPVTLKKEYYLTGGGEEAPGIGPFTSITANFAIATLMNLIKPYRALPDDLRQDNIWVDFVNMCIHSNAPEDNSGCIYCRKHLLLLKPEGAYRLGMPQLGKINDL